MRVDTDADDELITGLISEGISLAEYWLNISIREQDITLEATPRYVLDLPYRPINSVTSVKDRDDNELVYVFDGFSVQTTGFTDLVVVYKAGYTTVPEGLILGLKELIAYLYENRGDKDLAYFIKRNDNLQAYNKGKWWL